MDDLWPLLCEVVEAAERAYHRRGMQHKFLPEEETLRDVLAALRAEVVRDA